MTTQTPRLLPLASAGCGYCAPSGTASAPPATEDGPTPDLAVIFEATG